MGLPAVVAWPLTGVFLLLTVPYLRWLARCDHGPGGRHDDLSGLLMAVAMVAMASPVGAPVPMAGWQALFLVSVTWLLVAAPRYGDREARAHHLHHAVSSLAMLYMLATMPGSGSHGPWSTMSAPGPSGGWPLLTALAITYFTADGVRAAFRGGLTSRPLCRTAMGLGMATMFATTL